MATKRTVAKKTTSKKPATKGSASASKVPAKRAPETSIDKDRNTQAILSKDASGEKHKIHAKVVSLQVSVGTYDRGRNIEDFIKHVLDGLNAVPYGEEGTHASVMGSYYILDGKVCLPEDYDEKNQTFLPGKTPPVWAGGPKPTSATGASASQEQMARDAKELSSDEFDKKYKIGKYRQVGTGGTVITDEMKREHLKKVREERERAAEEDLEEFDWDESDVHDDEKLGAAADESAKEFTKKLKAKKVVKKKSAPKKTIKTVKKPESASKKPAKKVVKKRGK